MGNLPLYVRMIFLLPIALLWLLIDQPWDDKPGPIDAIKNTLLDWRYLYRGPIETKDVNTGEPVKVAYVDFDE